jgi:hypothetical protein
MDEGKTDFKFRCHFEAVGVWGHHHLTVEEFGHLLAHLGFNGHLYGL